MLTFNEFNGNISFKKHPMFIEINNNETRMLFSNTTTGRNEFHNIKRKSRMLQKCQSLPKSLWWEFAPVRFQKI